MLAAYSEDIISYMSKMIGRGGTSSKTPKGYDFFYNKSGATRFGPLGRMAERESKVGRKGFGFLSRPMRGISGGMEHLKGNFGKIGIAGIIASGAIESYTAPRGHKVTHGVKGVLSAISFGIGDVVGTAISGGNPAVGFALGTATEQIGSTAGDLFDQFSSFNRNVKHINMGGNYEDTRVAYTMRQRAAQEMGSSVMNARTWLGKEAALMHQ